MANNPKNHEDANGSIPAGQIPKEVICNGVYGKVKWFNVKRGYGFVCRNDNQEDVFIHQSAIVKSNPDHPRKSVGEGEEIQFDIVKGIKGNEAANVCGADGNHVMGSEYALRYQRSGRGRFRGRGRGRGGIRSRGTSEELEGNQQEFIRGGPQRGGRNFRGYRPYMMQPRKPYTNYDMPPPFPPQQFYPDYYVDYYRGPFRGRGGPFRGGRVFRGGPPREAQMDYPPHEYEFERRPRGGRGRSRFRGGRGRPWSGRGRGGSRETNGKDDHNGSDEHHDDEHAEEHHN